MHPEKPRSKKKQGQVNKGSGSDLLEQCELRKFQLEKIRFAYQNLDRLPPSLAQRTKNAILSNDPIVLWNFETDDICLSIEVDELMKQDGMQNSNYAMTSSDPGCFNGSNSVSMLDAAYTQLPPPLMHPGAIMSPPPMPQQFILSPNPNMQSNSSSQFFGQMPAPGPMSPQMMGRTMPYQTCYPPAQGQPIPSNPQHHPVQPKPVPVMSVGQVGTGYEHYIARSSVTANCQYWMVPSFPCIDANTNDTSPNNNHQEIKYGGNSRGYRRVTFTQSWFVPIATNTSTSCSTSSHPPDQNDMEYSLMRDLTISDRNEELDLNSNSEPSHKKDKSDDENRGDLTKPDSGSVEDDSIPVASSSSFTAPDVEGVLDLETINRSTTPTSEILKVYQEDGVEEEWQVLSDKKSFTPMQASHDVTNRAKPQSTRNSVATKEVLKEEEVPKAESSTSSDNRKPRTTKKEKRIREEQKAKELETDDVILEQALQERRAYEEEAARSGVQPVVMNDNKKKRTRAQIIAENNLIANPPVKVEAPHRILHDTKKTIEKRTRRLEQFGLPTTSTNPELKEYYETLDLFVRTLVRQPSDSITVLEFISRRLAEFQKHLHAQSLSRIMLYKKLFDAVPEAFMPELLFLSSLERDSNDKFEEFEEIFFKTF